MLKCNDCSIFVYKKYLLICEKCELCYHLLCVKTPHKNNEFVCEKCQINDKILQQLSQINSNIEDIEVKICKLSPIKEERTYLVNLVHSLVKINEEIKENISAFHGCDQEIVQKLEIPLEDLQVSRNSTKKRLDLVSSRVEDLLRSSGECDLNLKKIDQDLKICSSFIEETNQLMDDKLIGTVEETEELLVKILEIRTILETVLLCVQKFKCDKSSYLEILNSLRTSKTLEPILGTACNLEEIISSTTKDFNDLFNRVNLWLDWLSDGQNLKQQSEDCLIKAETWLNEIEPKVTSLLEEPTAKDSRQIKQQLKRSKTLHEELVTKKPLIEELKESTTNLLKIYHHQLTDCQIWESPVQSLDCKYQELTKATVTKQQTILQSLTQVQSLETTLENLEIWLKTVQEKVNPKECASLKIESLNQKILSQKLVTTEIENHVVSLKAIENSGDKQDEILKIQGNVEEVLKQSRGHEAFLEDIRQKLTNFDENYRVLNDFTMESQKNLLHSNNSSIFLKKTEEDMLNKKDCFLDTQKIGTSLLENKQVIDKEEVKKHLEDLSENWQNLNELLKKKVEEADSRSEEMIVLENEFKKLLQFYNELEGRLLNMDPVKQLFEELEMLEKDFLKHQEILETQNKLALRLKLKEIPIVEEVNNKSRDLQNLIHKKKQELNSTKQLLDKIKFVEDFLKKVEEDIVDEAPRTAIEAQNIVKKLHVLQLQLYEKHPILEEIQKSNLIPIGDLSKKWSIITVELQNSIDKSKNYEEFYINHDFLHTKLLKIEAIDINSDINLGSLQDQLRSLEPDFGYLGDLVKKLSGNSESSGIQEKYQNLYDKWILLSDKLKNITQSSNLDTELEQFHNRYDRLNNFCTEFQEKLDSATLEKFEEIDRLQRELEGSRILVSELESLSASICENSDSPVLIAEIQGKTLKIVKVFQGLQVKFDRKKAEIDNVQQEIQEFQANCAKLQGWLALKQLPEVFQISADRGKLLQQCEVYDCLNKAILEKEHEIVMISSDKNNNDELAGLGEIHKNWGLLKQQTEDRLKELKFAKEICVLFYESLEKFTPKLGINKCDAKKLEEMQPMDLGKLEQDVKTINDLGEKFLNKCQVDQEKVVGELQELKENWLKFELEIQEENSKISQIVNKTAEFKIQLNKLRTLVNEGEHVLIQLEKDSKKFEELQEIGDKIEVNLTEINLFYNELHEVCQQYRVNIKKLDKDYKKVSKKAAKLLNSIENCKNKKQKEEEILKIFGENVEQQKAQISELDLHFEQLESPIISKATIGAYLGEIGKFGEKLGEIQKEVKLLEHKADELNLKADVKLVKTELGKLQRKLGKTAKNWEENLVAVEKFENVEVEVLKNLENVQVKLIVLGENEVVALQKVESGENSVTNITNTKFESLNDVEVKKQDYDARILENNHINNKNGNCLENDEVDQVVKLNGKFIIINNLEKDDPKNSENEILEDMNKKHKNSKFLELDNSQSFREKDPKTLQEPNSVNICKSLEGKDKDIKTLQDQIANLKILQAQELQPLEKKLEVFHELGENLIKLTEEEVKVVGIKCSIEEVDKKHTILKENIEVTLNQLDLELIEQGLDLEVVKKLDQWFLEVAEDLEKLGPLSSDPRTLTLQMKKLENLQDKVEKRRLEVSKWQTNVKKEEIEEKFEEIRRNINKRLSELHQILPVAKDYDQQIGPFLDWLNAADEDLKNLSINDDDLEEKLHDYNDVSREIQEKTKNLHQMDCLAQHLAEMLQDVESQKVLKQQQHCSLQHQNLLKISQEEIELLTKLKNNVVLVQDFENWLQETLCKVVAFRVLPVLETELLEHQTGLISLKQELQEHQPRILELLQIKNHLHLLPVTDNLREHHINSMKSKFDDLKSQVLLLQKTNEEFLPIVQDFQENLKLVTEWLVETRGKLKNPNLADREIINLEVELGEYKPLLELLHILLTRIIEITPLKATVLQEKLEICQLEFLEVEAQIVQFAEKVATNKRRFFDAVDGVDELLDWLKNTEEGLNDTGRPSADPYLIADQLQAHKQLNNNINDKRATIKDTIKEVQEMLRESSPNEDMLLIKEKVEDLRDTMQELTIKSTKQLEILEEAYQLAEHFHETHNILDTSLEDIEEQLALTEVPQQQDFTENLQKTANDYKPLIEKLNKNGEALIQICNDSEAVRVQELLNTDNSRYSTIKSEIRQQQEALEKALLENSQLTDKLDGMIKILENTAEQVHNFEPISGQIPKIKEQLQENQLIIDDLEKRRVAYESVKTAANNLIGKSTATTDPQIKDIQNKLVKLDLIWNEVQEATNKRNLNLKEALAIAEEFWTQVEEIKTIIRNLEAALLVEQPPSAQVSALQEQQQNLETLRPNLDLKQPKLEQLRTSAQQLISICAAQDQPEIQTQTTQLEETWDSLLQVFLKREQNLITAMDKAMQFHDSITNLGDFLNTAESKLGNLQLNLGDVMEIKRQLGEVQVTKKELEPHLIKIETLHRQAQELYEITPTDHGIVVAQPLQHIKSRFDILQEKISVQKQDLEKALLDLGNFDLALEEMISWIVNTIKIVEDVESAAGDLEKLEVAVAKMQVIMKDVKGHQVSVDSIKEAAVAKQLQQQDDKLKILETKWGELLGMAAGKLGDLEVLLKNALLYDREVKEARSWLDDVANNPIFRKPIGGLQETASEQLENFMLLYQEVEDNRLKIEGLLSQAPNLGASAQQNLHLLKQQWDLVTVKVNDKKIKLEIALREAQKFQESFKEFADWLTETETVVTKWEAVARVWSLVQTQMEEHKVFHKDVSEHRTVMYNLDKKGTQIKYFAQKEDAVLIKNLLVSLQHRWDRLNVKTMERSKELEVAFKETKEFTDNLDGIMNWLVETETEINGIDLESQKIKQQLQKFEDILKVFKDKQIVVDKVHRLGRSLRFKARRDDIPLINKMLSELREKWQKLYTKTVEGHRKLEKSLLQSGHYSDTVASLIQWLKKAEKELTQDSSVYGDLETVSTLMDNHKLFENELESRFEVLESLRKLGNNSQELEELWSQVHSLTHEKQNQLKQALEEAKKLSQKFNFIQNWMMEADEKLAKLGDLPDDEHSVNQQLKILNQFREELHKIKNRKDEVCELALVILTKCHPDATHSLKNQVKETNNHWNKITRWVVQRHQKLMLKLKYLEDFDKNVEDLLEWVLNVEKKINDENHKELPMEMGRIFELIEQHKQFMKEVEKRQSKIDKVVRSKPVRTPSKWISGLKRRSLPLQLDLKSPRVQFLHDKWREIWVLLWDRQQKLRNHLIYLKDKEKADKFSWEDWRRRFLKFMCYKKSRVVDLLKKLDKDHNDLIPSEEFIQGILRTKFDTNRLELLQLVKLFDLDNKDLIDWRQFLKALRPEWEEKPTNVDDAKILTEFKKIVLMCKCKDRIKVVHVGDGRYKIGDNQKIRLVRILKSTVMVRVGGGWVTLQEFLKKNDPCRTVGRTNLELREKYLLPEGASQALATFRSKFGVFSPRSPTTPPSPVVKIREKTAKSVPMSHSVYSHSTTTHFTYQTVQPLIRSRNSWKSTSRLGSRQNSFVLEKRSLSKSNPKLSSNSNSKPSSALGSRQGSIILEKDGIKSRIPRFKLTRISPANQEDDQNPHKNEN